MPLNLDARRDFLRHHGWQDAQEFIIGEDWSQRTIIRLTKSGRTAILMHSLPNDDPLITPGHKPADFVKIDRYLASLGLSVPEIYAAAPELGLLLVEDLGVDTFHEHITGGKLNQVELYSTATDVLIHLFNTTENISIDLPDYYASHVHTARRRIIDWHLPAVRQRRNEAGLLDEYLAVWADIEKSLPSVSIRFQHIDFHPHNLTWLSDRDGIKRVGMVDFQGAMRGPAPYDIANLLFDARRIVPDAVQLACRERLRAHLRPDDLAMFDAWLPVLACQMHCRVIGQAIRLAVKDKKTRLLALIPVLQAHLKQDLHHPLLAPLGSFMVKHGIDLSAQLSIDPDSLGRLIADDAF